MFRIVDVIVSPPRLPRSPHSARSVRSGSTSPLADISMLWETRKNPGAFCSTHGFDDLQNRDPGLRFVATVGRRARRVVFAIVDLHSSPDRPPGDAVESFIRREDAERTPISPHRRTG